MSQDAVEPQIESQTSPEAIARTVEDLPPEESARAIAELSPEVAAKVSESLDPETAARALSRMDGSTAALIIGAMEAPEASLVLEHMNPDDRVDLLEFVKGPLRERLVNEMTAVHREEVRQLEQYPRDTAGGIMTTEVTALYERITVDDAITLLRRLSQELEQMYYVYVINRNKQLVGVLSMRDLILANPQTRLHDIMIRNVRSVPGTMDQEAVAQLMRANGYLAMPVVDSNNVLLGLITSDDVMEVFQEEATEDVQKMFGAGAEERLNSPWHYSFKKRVWWLIVNLGTAFLAGAVVAMFEKTIGQNAILAAYMPIVAGTGGNASAQSMAVVVRGMAVGEVDRELMKRVIRRQLLVGVCIGTVIGIITMLIAVLFHLREGPHDAILLGIVICTALIINHALACTTGAIIPFIMKQLGFDPAQSATIFATTVTDVVGFFALLGLASVFLLKG